MIWHQQPLQLQCQPQPTVGTLLLLSWRRCPCHDHVVAVDVKVSLPTSQWLCCPHPDDRRLATADDDDGGVTGGDNNDEDCDDDVAGGKRQIGWRNTCRALVCCLITRATLTSDLGNEDRAWLLSTQLSVTREQWSGGGWGDSHLSRRDRVPWCESKMTLGRKSTALWMWCDGQLVGR